jgi:uncharacterized Zn finger protein (UPF0148 family)
MTPIKQHYCKTCGTPLFFKRPKSGYCRTCIGKKANASRGINVWTQEELATVKTLYALRHERFLLYRKLIEGTYEKNGYKQIQTKIVELRRQIKSLKNSLTLRHNYDAIYFQANRVLHLNTKYRCKTKPAAADPIQELFLRVRVALTKTAGRLNK